MIATLRALCSLYAVGLAEPALAELALAVEVQELGIAAGLQDRVAQSYGGLTFMDFDPAAGPGRYERLDRSLLPPLVIAGAPTRKATPARSTPRCATIMRAASRRS